MGRLFIDMWILLFFKAYFTRAWRSHLLLILLLACAISLPIGLSILESSYVCGAMEDNIRRGVVHDMKIENAVAGDEVYFQTIADAEVFWEDGTLYIDAHETLTKDESTAFADLAREIAAAHPEKKWMVNNLAGLQAEESWYRFPVQYHLAVGGFAAFLVCAAFGSFWRQQRTAIGQLQAIGAQNHQIGALYFSHFAIVLSLATIVSLGCTCLVLGVMTIRFLGYTLAGVDAAVFATAALFRFSIEWNLLLLRLGVVWGIAAVFFLLVFPFRLFRKSIRAILHRAKPLVSPRLRSHKYAALWRVFIRSGAVKPLLCAVLAAPMLVSAILLIQQREDTDSLLEDLPEYAFSVHIDARHRTFSTDDLREIEKLPKIEAVSEIGRWDLSYYYRDDPSHRTLTEAGETVPYSVPYLCPTRMELPMAEAVGEKTVYSAAIYAERVPEDWREGAVVTLIKGGAGEKYIRIVEILDTAQAEAILAENGLQLFRDADGLSLNQYTENGESVFLGACDALLFLREEDAKTLNAFQRLDGFQVKIAGIADAETVQHELLDCFAPGDIIFFDDHYAGHIVAYNRAVGMNLLYTTLSVLLFGFFAVITTLSLIDYAASHAETLRLLHMQGASHRAIVAAFVEIMLPPGILTCAAVWAIVTPVEREYYRLRGYTEAYMPQLGIQLDDPLYLAAALAVVAVFVAPVICTVVRQLRRLNRG